MSEKFTECKLCGKKFLVLKKQGVVDEKVCSECYVPKPKVIFSRKEIKLTNWSVSYDND